MRDDADERPGGIARQTRVRIEREAVAHARKHVEPPDLRGERRIARASQQAVELVDLAALAFPAHPDALARIPAAFAVKQEEPIGMTGAEPDDSDPECPRTRRRQHRRHPPRAWPSARPRSRSESRSGCVDRGCRTPARPYARCSAATASAAGQQRRHDDHRPRVLRDAVGEVEARQPARAHGRREEALDRGHRQIEGRQHQERERHDQRPRGVVDVRQPPGGRHEQERRHGENRPEIAERRVMEGDSPDARRATWADTRRRIRDRRGRLRRGDTRRAPPDRRSSHGPRPVARSRSLAARAGPGPRRVGAAICSIAWRCWSRLRKSMRA